MIQITLHQISTYINPNHGDNQKDNPVMAIHKPS